MMVLFCTQHNIRLGGSKRKKFGNYPKILSYLEAQTCFGGKMRTILMLLTPYLQNLIIPTSTHLSTNLSYQPETS